MIDLKGIMGIPLLKKSRFTGSDGNLRYVLEKRSSEEEGDRLVRTHLSASTGPLGAEVAGDQQALL